MRVRAEEVRWCTECTTRLTASRTFFTPNIVIVNVSSVTQNDTAVSAMELLHARARRAHATVRIEPGGSAGPGIPEFFVGGPARGSVVT